MSEECKYCGEMLVGDWLSCDDGEFCHHEHAHIWRLETEHYTLLEVSESQERDIAELVACLKKWKSLTDYSEAEPWDVVRVKRNELIAKHKESK